jgi:hemoglobin
MDTSPLLQTSEKPVKAERFSVERHHVRSFIEAFYVQVRQDTLLAPVFARVVPDAQWPEHFETMTDFWMAVAFGGPAFRGNPMVKHARIRDIAPAHFERWLAVFTQVANEFWNPDIAYLLVFRAQQIAPALQAGVTRAREKSLVTASDLH